MREYKFLIFLIVVLEVAIFCCGLRVVSNRHHARALFIELEREQQIYHSLRDERAKLQLIISNLEQVRLIDEKARQEGLSPVSPNDVVILGDNRNKPQAPQNPQDTNRRKAK